MRYQTTRAAELETLETFRDIIDQACQENGIVDDACHDLKLAVDEACTNIITHGYKDMNPGSIMLVLEFEPSSVAVEITDFGHAFEPVEPEAPDLETSLADPSGEGMGLYFIYQTMDEISYRSGEDGNVLTFIKRMAR